MSTLAAEERGAALFGARCPKKSAIHEYWQRLDRLFASPDIPRQKSKEAA